jgi:hypothetical protein
MNGSVTARHTRDPVPWHPVLLTAALVVSFWADTLVHPAAVVRALLVAVVMATALVIAIHLARWNSGKVAAVLSLLLVIAWAKHPLRYYVGVAWWLSWIQLAVLTLLILAALALALRIAIRLAPRAWNSPNLTMHLNRASALLVAAVLFTSVVSGGLGAISDLSPERASRSVQPAGPDVYLILLDGYARADVLDHVFGYDNSPFVEDLEARRFNVARNSHTPYLFTRWVLQAILHRDYVDNIIPPQAGGADQNPDRGAIRLAINHNPVFADFRQRGYQVVATNSGYEQYSLRAADEFFDAGEMNEFELELLQSTFIGDLVTIAYPDIGSSQVRSRIVSSLDHLPVVAARDDTQPALVLAHIPAPHQPTVFGANGEPVVTRLDSRFFHDTSAGSDWTLPAFMDRYTGEVTHLNGLVLSAIDGILEESPRPPIIIVMSDHGSASRVDWLATSPAEADSIDRWERTSSFFAAYTPGHSDVFPDDVVPVDIFRYLSDAYFGTNLGTATPPPGGRQLPAVPAP